MKRAANKIRTSLGPLNEPDTKHKKENNDDIGEDGDNIYKGDYKDIRDYIIPNVELQNFCRRDAKLFGKMIDDPVCAFFVANIQLPLPTLKAYYKIIKEFEDYSPSLHWTDFDKFLKFKFAHIQTSYELSISQHRDYLKYC